MRDTIFHVLFVWYPYVCLSAFIFVSIIRFDREQLHLESPFKPTARKRQLTWGSNLFHVGILFLLMGHTVGLLTPTAIYSLVITPEAKQLLAIVAGSIAGLVCFIGLTLLLHRRLFDSRIRQTSTYMDLAVLIILWVQLSIGLLTVPFSLAHPRCFSDADAIALGAGHSDGSARGREDAAGTGIGPISSTSCSA